MNENVKRKAEYAIIVFTLIFSIGFLISNTQLFDMISSPTGKATTILSILKPEEAICNFTLVEDENLVSFPCIRGQMPTPFMLKSIENQYDYIFYYGSASGDSWKSYNPNLPSWVDQDLNFMNGERGFWIFMKNGSEFYFNGSAPIINKTSLSNGWNLIGYPKSQEKNISDAVVSIDGNYNIILSYNSSRNCIKNTIKINDVINYNSMSIELMDVTPASINVDIDGLTKTINLNSTMNFENVNDLQVRLESLYYHPVIEDRNATLHVDCEPPYIPMFNRTSNRWESYGPEGDDTLDKMTTYRGYWIYMTSTDELDFT